MVTLTTATEMSNHRAPEAVRIDHTLHTLDPAREAIASRVTDGEVVPLASRATWLATGSGGAGTVVLLGLQQFGTPGAVDRRPSRRRWRGERDGPPGLHRHECRGGPLVLEGAAEPNPRVRENGAHDPEAAPATVIRTCRPVNLKLSYRNSATHM
jgi:hypothetical protein